MLKRIILSAACLTGLIFSQNSIITQVPSSAAGSKGIAVKIFYPDSARYGSAGAPVVISIPGGWNAGGITPLGVGYIDYGFIVIAFAMIGFDSGTYQSGGEYDVRGINCVTGLKDIALFAMGKIPDTSGKSINELVPNTVKACTTNVGFLGSSNGGNLAITAAGVFRKELGELAWIVNKESPVGKGMPTALAGWNLGGKTTINPAFNNTTGEFDFKTLKYTKITRPGLPSSTFYFDVNENGVLDPAVDFMTTPLRYEVAGSNTAFRWDELVILNAFKNGIVPAPVPDDVMDTNDVKEFWKYRNGANWVDSAVAGNPGLAFMVVANETDHAQSAPSHPHIVIQYNLFKNAGAFSRINPDRAYLEYVTGIPDPDAVDNMANADFGYTNITDALEKDGYERGLQEAAGICEMADRRHYDDYSVQLEEVISSSPSTTIGNEKYISLEDGLSLSYSRTAPVSINYQILEDDFIGLTVLNMQGKVVKTFVNKRQRSGKYSVHWDGKNDRGAVLSNGQYVIRLKAGKQERVKKVLLLQ
ncbi:MAG: hypothetical protein HQK83_05440 [Fibrobacteria bacterium]|nr:hypothetical protein [Fibrobacteria bacterium]